MKRAISLLLVLTLCLSLAPLSAFAEEETEPGLSNDVAFEGETSVGGLIANTFDGEGETAGGEGAYGGITDITVSGGTATVFFTTTRDADLIVAVYTDDGAQLLGSGRVSVDSEDNYEEVPITISVMPQYFAVGAYLLDARTHEPLCEQYISQTYTQQMQEFLAKTAEEFDSDRVLDLDGDSSTNFLVFKEDAVIVDETAGVNEITDNGDGTYTITHADERFQTLEPGGTFSYTYENGDVLIVVADAVTAVGDTVTVTAKPDSELRDVFEYVRIEADSWGVQPEVEASPGVTLADEFDAPELNGAWVDEDVGASFSQGFVLSEKAGEDLSVSVSGSVTFSGTLSLKIYIDWDWQYIDLEFTSKLALTLSLEGAYDDSITLGVLTLPLAAGINAVITAKIAVEYAVSLSWEGSISNTCGFVYDSRSEKNGGWQTKDSAPKVSSRLELEGSLFVGPELEFAIVAVDEKLAKISASAKVGAEITATLPISDFADGDDDDCIHDCTFCLDGDVKAVAEGSAYVTMLWDALKVGGKIAHFEKKLTDFYYSRDYDEFALGTCPHLRYRVEVTVRRETRTLPDMKILGTGLDTDPVTDEKGVASFYLPNGKYALISTGGGKLGTKDLIVRDGAIQATIWMKNDTTVKANGYFGDDISWALYKSGRLVLSGTGLMWDFGYQATHADAREAINWDEVRLIEVGDGILSVGEYAFKECPNLIGVSLADSVCYIGRDAFYNCVSLSEINLPSTLSSIGQNAFRYCSSLQEIDIPSGITAIEDNVFYGCSSLRRVSLPAALTSIGYFSFADCSSLERIDLPDGLTSVMQNTFNGSGLRSVTVPGSLKTLNFGVFSSCRDLTSVTLEYGVETIYDYAFGGCTSLSDITIPESVTSIGRGVFGNCQSLETIELPDSVTLMKDAFAGGYDDNGTPIRSIRIPANLTEIHPSTFYKCRELESVTLPVTLTQIGEKAFSGCSSLKDVYYEGSREQWSSTGFGTHFSQATVHYDCTYAYDRSTGGLDGAPEITPEPEEMTAPEETVMPEETPEPEITPEAEITPEPTPGPEPEETPEPEPTPETEPEETPEPETTPAADGEIVLAAMYTGLVTEDGSAKLASFTGLKPGARYAFIVSTGTGDTRLTAENLLYIAQGTADGNGSLAFSYVPRADDATAARTAWGPFAGIYGDADGDGAVMADDIARLLRCADGIVPADETMTETLDVDGDGLLTFGDGEVIASFILGRIELFPVE